MTGPTLATVKAAQAAAPESLWVFLSHVPATLEAQIFYALMIFGLVGMMGHYTRLWLTDQIEGSLWGYLVHQYPKRTLLTVGAYAAWAIGLLSTSTFENDQGAFVGWMNVIVIAITNGYGADSLANKGTPPPREQWTDAQRAAQTVPTTVQPRKDSP